MKQIVAFLISRFRKAGHDDSLRAGIYPPAPFSAYRAIIPHLDR